MTSSPPETRASLILRLQDAEELRQANGLSPLPEIQDGRDHVDRAGIARLGADFPSGLDAQLGPIRELRMSDDMDGMYALDFDRERTFMMYDTLAMECIEQLEASDPTKDYRRNGAVHLDYQLNIRIPRSLAKAEGMDAATDWAESLTDQDKQLVACVVLLEMATEHIREACDYKRSPIAVELDRIDPSYMVAVGC